MALIDVANALILVMGISAAFLVSSSSARHRFFGFTIAALSEPCWIYVSVETCAWGIFVLSLWYLGCNVRGAINSARELRDETSNRK